MTEVTKFDDARVQVVYDILCTYVRPPSGEDLKRFVARRIVDALAAPTSEVIAGALFDFLGYLTTLPAQEAVTFSECHEASSAAEHLEKWAEKRSLSLDEADLFGWHTTKAESAHPDDIAVDSLATAMKFKLAKQRSKGYGGWDTDCTQQRLSDLLRGHVSKGDPVDVVNFCAFLVARGEGIQAEVQPKTAELPKGVAQFTKKPVTINAIQWDSKNLYEVISFTQGVPNTRSERAQDAWDDYAKIVEREGLHIDTLEGKMLANVGDWIIRGVKGEHYPCKPDIFAATYEPATAPQAEVQAEPVAGDYPHEQMDALALARYKVVPSGQSMYWRHAVVAGDGQQHLYNGSEVDCQNMARKFAGAFLDGAFTFHQRYTAPRAAPSDALDAMRFRALFGAAIAEDETFIDAFNSIFPDDDSKVTLDEIRTAIDASIAAQATQGAKP